MIGTTVSHYRVFERLGAGGMGVVYRAEDLRLGRHVALKFLPDSAIADPLAVERFQREARTASALNHPNICTIHDVGEHEGHRFLVMELIDGTTLDRVLTAGALPIDRVVDVSSQIADALDAAHSEGILHRDVKPGNVFVTRRGQVKVVDFGLAKMMQPVGAMVAASVTVAHPHLSTSAGIAVGTVAYMSPEHARGESLDPRSDLFSLGIVMYEMSTGSQTFKGQTTAVVFDQILNRVPPPPSMINPAVPLSLEQVIARLLEKDRQLRYQTARDLHADLQRLRRDLDSRRFAQHGPVSVADAWSHSGQTPAPTTETDFGHFPALPGEGPGFSTPRPRTLSGDAPTAFAPPPGPATPAGIPPPPAAEARPDDAASPESRTTSSKIVAAAATAGGSTSAAPAAPAPPFSGPVMSGPPPAGTPVPAIPARQPAVAPAARPRRPLSWPMVGGIAAGLVAVIAGLAFYFARGRDVPIGAAETVTRPNVPAPSPAPPPPATPAPATVQPAAAPSAVESPAPETPPPNPVPTPARVAARTSAAPANVRPTATAPVPAARSARSSAAARDAEAARLLEAGRAQVASGAVTEGLAALAAVANDFSGTPSAVDALAFIAQTHADAGRYAEAIGAWTDLGRRGAGDRASEGLIRAADGAARQKTPATDELARQALGELLTQYPSSVRALRALQMKMALEDRMKLRSQDPEFEGATPTSLLTLRDVAIRGGSTAVAEFALWRLGDEYRGRRLNEQAVATYTSLANRFPSTRYDAWFAAGELLDKLRRPEEARAAFAKVPASSPKYEQARKRAQPGS